MAVHICGSRRIWTVYRSSADNGSDLSRPVCVVPVSRLSALATCVQPLVHVSEPLSERTSAAQLHDHYLVPLLQPSAAVTTVAPDSAYLFEQRHVIGQARRHRQYIPPPHFDRARSLGEARRRRAESLGSSLGTLLTRVT